MWRSEVREDFAGKVDFDVAAPYRSQLPPDGDMSVSITLPQSVSIGAAYRPTPVNAFITSLSINGHFGR
ncbi:MAG TPA: hypothetical protein VFT22_08150 [Kofleriaceae bacterium]|nr:hypothetical protein [Kofleriaceae bacterium]